MGVIVVEDLEGQRHTLEALDGWRVMEIIRDWGLPIKAICGGACECATCHVRVAEPWLDKLYPPTDDEMDKLDTVPEVWPNSRLACQILWNDSLDGLEVALTPDCVAG
jgi:2Fe-2S ferredoxin